MLGSSKSQTQQINLRSALQVLAQLLLLVGAALSETVLKIENVKLNNAEVRFEATNLTNLGSETTDLSSMSSAGTSGGKFRVFLDLNNVRRQLLFYTYEVYIKRGDRTDHLRVQAWPTGQFEDFVSKVNFSVQDGQITDTGQLNIPLHSREGKDYLRRGSEGAATVDLVNGSNIEISVANTSAELPLFIDPDVTLSQQHAEYWRSITHSQSDRAKAISLAPGQTQTLFTLNLQPSFASALRGSIMPLGKDEGHDVITLNLQQHTEFGGPVIPTAIHIPVRFVPSFWSLLVAVLCGAVVGSLTAFVLATEPDVKWWHTVLASILIASLTEIAGIVTMNANSKVVLFGFDLDPRQVLPAFFLGAVMGLGGLRGAQTIRDTWTKRRENV